MTALDDSRCRSTDVSLWARIGYFYSRDNHKKYADPIKAVTAVQRLTYVIESEREVGCGGTPRALVSLRLLVIERARRAFPLPLTKLSEAIIIGVGNTQ